MAMSKDAKVVVCGAGIIGASVAYHLAERGVSCTLVEKSGIACAASGKAGGFLALDWCDQSPVGQLARASFPMHEQLAKTLGTEVDYRKLQTYAASIVPRRGQSADSRVRRRGRRSTVLPKALGWLDGNVTVSRVSKLGDERTTAQVHPRKLANAFLAAAREKCGTTVKQAIMTSVEMDGTRVIAANLKSPKGEEEQLPCTHLVLAMGPWSTTACKWFRKLPPVLPQKACSIVINATVPGQAIFTSYVDTAGKGFEPEVYPRPDGTVYICSSGANEPLPEDPQTIVPRPADIGHLKNFASDISTSLASGDVVLEQACYLPCVPGDGLPLIGPVPETEGVYIATGHSVWGILNSPATGKAVADLIVDGKTEVANLDDFSPARFA